MGRSIPAQRDHSTHLQRSHSLPPPVVFLELLVVVSLEALLVFFVQARVDVVVREFAVHEDIAVVVAVALPRPVGVVCTLALDDVEVAPHVVVGGPVVGRLVHRDLLDGSKVRIYFVSCLLGMLVQRTRRTGDRRTS